MINNNRYYSRKINLAQLLIDDSKISKKKFNLTSAFHEPEKEIHGSAPENSRGDEIHPITREHTARYLSPKEYASIISMIIASAYLLLISFFPLVYNFTSSFEPMDFLKNFLYFMIGLGTISGVFYYLRKETYLQHIADQIFERVIYQRLEPVLKDVAEVQVGINNVQGQLEMMNINIGALSDKKAQASTATPDQMTYYSKYIVLINITLAAFLFMLQYPLGYIPYAVTVLFLLWWIIITAEYRLWNIEIAWTWAFFPIILLPIYTIIMNAYLEDYQLFGSLSIGLCIYILSYYYWCSYIVKGVLPFDLQDIIKNIHEKNPGVNASKRIGFPKLDLKLNPYLRHNIAVGLILLAIALFGLTWLGYAIQHELIPYINWAILGMEGFEWSSSYTYFLNISGILLILTGFKFLKQIKT